jgi:hypothetical protein
VESVSKVGFQFIELLQIRDRRDEALSRLTFFIRLQQVTVSALEVRLWLHYSHFDKWLTFSHRPELLKYRVHVIRAP